MFFLKFAKKYNKKFLKVQKTAGWVEVPKRPGKVDIEIKTIYGQKASPLGSTSSGALVSGIDNKILSETLLVGPIQWNPNLFLLLFFFSLNGWHLSALLFGWTRQEKVWHKSTLFKCKFLNRKKLSIASARICFSIPIPGHRLGSPIDCVVQNWYK